MIVCFFCLREGGFATAVIQHNNFFYLFDSHSRGVQWLSIADSTSVLFKFTSILEVESNIHVTYLQYRDIQQSYFQVQFLNIDINRSSCLSIISHHQRFCRNHHLQKSSMENEEVNLRRYRY